jgi:hypothetical protein
VEGALAENDERLRRSGLPDASHEHMVCTWSIESRPKLLELPQVTPPCTAGTDSGGRGSDVGSTSSDDDGGDGGHGDVAGLAVYSLIHAETQFVFWEIFQRRCYAFDGWIQLLDGDTVLDVGAHIGLFSLWANMEADLAAVYAYEPMPVQHAALTANIALHSLGTVTRPTRAAVGAVSGEEEFTCVTCQPA